MYTLIIPAAGQGKRMGAGKNKLFLLINEVPIIVHTLRAFEKDKACKNIVMAINEEERPYFEELIQKYRIQKDVHFIQGGAERQDSVYNAVQHVKDVDYVLVHDGARPFVTNKMIHAVLTTAKQKGASICAVPVKDTVKKVEQDTVVETVERSQLRAVQTPQGFSVSLLLEAHRSAKQGCFLGTDDASLVERIGKEVGVVEGSYYNIKVTTPEDLVIAESFLRVQKEQ
ncbi:MULTISPECIES: 2-C-methyl-D-erythritol 4-phosphate cytidylyltransferase [Bacillus cereus group]|uniref:2-C-methyl-D-erythritol 4-phosphate cytidylyltransferase n=1 Tax=Bacillus cereus TaxID=1396 RepID=A0AA44QBT1_BACCE|nr:MULTISPECIES: 2-C-methyl-D-erythritol 4-phosphate cytidylyltransferase [Bacillus cereus group]EEL52549.1 2-C-methyl-D-erythritol 4-phosphate cytidylyltransferase [Bacillus cereus Rock3-44]PFA23174.1 2-C-methyl-D-erythritol 4-phosphate cytidylyltransferase [Bacillus cereus]PFN04869.1 2-C-methyl-D-erythritol 4-phosphate cytidylyltransferase [Bacillus cereus]PFO82770.1 2-C-methyl-D-erythritol 4-phosphate cytidylyltransferase [Bacillus cereus]PFR26700.1 2-C-methyl-D-erythritol 4-phosphate cytid